MKIAFLTPEFATEESGYGGLSSYLDRVTKLLVKRGHSVSVFTNSTINGYLERNGVKIYRICFPQRLFNILNKLSIYQLPEVIYSVILSIHINKRFQDINKKEKFDVVQSTNFTIPHLTFSKDNNPPIILRLSSISKLYAQHQNTGSIINNEIMHLFETFGVSKSSRVYSPSERTSKIATRIFNRSIDTIAPPQLEVREVEIYSNRKIPKKLRNKKYILYFGRINALKGIGFIADNIKKLLVENPSLHMVFIGKSESIGDEDSKQVIQHKSGNSLNRVIFYDTISHTKLIPIIRSAWAILVPSSFDNLPNTLIESMSLKKIVIATKESGAEQLIRNNKEGFLVNFGDNSDFRKIINKVCLLSRKDKLKIENAAAKSIGDKLDQDRQISQLESYFKI